MAGLIPSVTISRQAGSGGREAGKCLAQMLGIPYYDYEILDRAAQETGLDPALFERAELSAAKMMERLEAGLPATETPINSLIFAAQSRIIRELAEAGPCVIVGRCADSVLHDMDNVIHVYIYASEERRIQNTMKKKCLSPAMAKVFVQSVDRGRQAYHNFFSPHPWGDMSSYDLCICTDKRTPEETAKAIIAFLTSGQC